MSNIPAFVTALRGKFAIFAGQRHCLESNLPGDYVAPIAMTAPITGIRTYGEISQIPLPEAWNHTVANQ